MRQTVPASGAKTSLSGCSTNTFHPVDGTVAHALSTRMPLKLRPVAEPVGDGPAPRLPGAARRGF